MDLDNAADKTFKVLEVVNFWKWHKKCYYFQIFSDVRWNFISLNFQAIFKNVKKCSKNVGEMGLTLNDWLFTDTWFGM